MREILYDAAAHYRRGRELADSGATREALDAWHEAIRDLHAVRPQRMRDVLLAQVYLACHAVSRHDDPRKAEASLRTGYSYARTTREPSVRQLAEQLWAEHLAGSGTPGDRSAS